MPCDRSGAVAVGDPGGGLGNAHRYAYDSYNRLRTTAHADRSTEQRTYDAAGNLASWTTRAGERLNFSYDTQNRRTSKVNPVGTTRTSCDLGSCVVRIASPGAILTYAYNVRDQLVTETSQPVGRTSAWTVSRSYDGVENSTKFTCPGGSAYHYVRDALNRITAVRDATRQNLVSYSHDSLSRMARAERQSGARSTASFDEVSRPLVVAHRQSATATSSLLSLSHARDTVGQITSLTDDLGIVPFDVELRPVAAPRK